MRTKIEIFCLAVGVAVGGGTVIWDPNPYIWWPIILVATAIAAISAALIFRDVVRKTTDKEQGSTEYIALNDAVMDAWERIRTLPEFDRQPSHSPEFASLRDYYEREPAKLPGIAAQIIFNSANPPLPIEGMAPPRTVMEVIPKDIAIGYMFSDDATEMFDVYDREKPAEQRRRYTKLRVKRANIERRVKAIEEDNGKG